MIIEIRGISFPNKGSHLMLLAITSMLRHLYPEAQLTMAPGRRPGHRDFVDIIGAGLLPKLDLSFRGIDFGYGGSLIPSRLREMYGLVLDREVDVVLDASGFAYSDQWGSGPIKELANASSRWASWGTKVVLMPQAFGPFEASGVKTLVQSAIQNCSLVMPRDRASSKFLTDAVGRSHSIRQYPDFTVLLEGKVPADFDVERNRFCVVPNVRMQDKVAAGVAENYLPFLIRVVKILESIGAAPFLLVHEGQGDIAMAKEVVRAVGDVPVVTESDPLKIKGILGRSTAVIGSRFHALVSALSQGVPAVATSWSHKYSELLQDYGFKSGLLDVRATDSELRKKIELLLDVEASLEIRQEVRTKAEDQKRRTVEMWNQIRTVIEE